MNMRLTSSNFINTPNFIAAMRNDFNLGEKYKTKAVHIVAETYFSGNKKAAIYVLANPDKCHKDEDNALVVNGLAKMLNLELKHDS